MNKLSFRVHVLANMLNWPFRRTITGEVRGKVIVLDYLKIERAHIEHCDLLYGGGPLCMHNTIVSDCKFGFYGKAGNTLQILKFLDSETNTALQETFPNSLR